MTEEDYGLNMADYLPEISKKIIELDSFEDADISLLKKQLHQGIGSRKKMAVVPMEEIRAMMIGMITIRMLEEKLGLEF